MSWEVEYFKRSDGLVPAAQFEDAASPKIKAKLHVWIGSIADSEGAVGGGRFEKCHSFPGLYEVRVRVGRTLGRELCMRDGDRLVMLHGFEKPNDTPTPENELRIAVKYMQEYNETKSIVGEGGDSP